MNRRQWLRGGCAYCATAWAGFSQAAVGDAYWQAPGRFERPALDSDEGGLWALMDREETRIRRSPAVIRDAGLREYLQQVACRLGSHHCPDVRVYPVRVAQFNASMAPNGMLQIWSGLLLRMDNEAQLASVVGHEIGHYLQRHSLSRLRDAKSRAGFATFMALFGVVGLVGQMAAVAGVYAFSREHEREADLVGLRLMRDSGYDMREAARVWENLMAERAAVPNRPTETSPFFATHPPSDERSALLRTAAEQATGGERGESAYVSRIAPFLPDLLDDELQRNTPAESLVLLDRLVQRKPDSALLLCFRAEARRLRAMGDDLDLALRDLQRAIELGQEPPRTHRALGYIHRERRQPTQARAAFATYLERAPDAADAALVRTYVEEGGS